jgi:flagellar P-ring protein precursor FlgI
MSTTMRLLRIILALVSLAGAQAGAQSRIKDVATIVGARDNQLTGYGLVVGLNGTGDSDAAMGRQTIANLVQQFGINIRPEDVKAKNSAIVLVTARLPAFARNGSRIDVSVASVADSKSLSGGTLLQTPLIGADGRIYAVAQGSLLIGGFFAGGEGSSVQRNHPTSASIPGGALVEREIPTDVFASGALELSLREPDFTSAVRMANAINNELGRIAEAVSSSTVRVYVPNEARAPERRMEFVARVENVLFRPDAAARIVINERTGTVVANSRIRIDQVAVAHGNLTISIVRTPQVSQPNPFTGNTGAVIGGSGGNAAAAPGTPGLPPVPLIIGGNFVYENDLGDQIQLQPGRTPPAGFRLLMQPGTGVPGVVAPGGAGAPAIASNGVGTVVTTQETTTVDEQNASLVVLEDMPTVGEVARALNALGVTPRDMMTIFQSMKQAGALQAELVLQ